MAISNENLEDKFNLEAINADILDSDCEKEIKIVVMGEIDSGKSSLIKIFFGNDQPQDLLLSEIEPTVGAEINVFDKGNTKVGVFDLAGQEMERWLSNKNSEMFYETDGIFLFYTLSNNLKKKEIERTSKQIRHILKEKAPKCQVNIILNKYDDYINSKKGNLKKANQIKIMVKEVSGFPTYLSALTPNYYPLLQLKLNRILGEMPVDPPNVALSENSEINLPSVNLYRDNDGHIVKGMSLQDASHVFEQDYDEKISRMEIMQSEFSLGR